MNKELIYKIIKPHLNSKKELTYSDFDKLFLSLEKKEKYAVCDLLADLNIELVDEKTTNDPYIENLSIAQNEHTIKTLIIKKGDTNKNTLKTNKEKTTLNKYKHESNEYLIELYQRTQKNSILNILINKNFKYIIKKAKQASFYYNHNLLDEDLYQIAIMGFICGCKKFDPTKGYNLLTYATFWIDQSLRREIMNTGFLIRLPVHTWEKINKVNKILSKYSPDDEIESLLSKEGIASKTIAEVTNLKSNYLNPEYLDSYAFNDTNLTVMDTISERTNCFISNIPTPNEETAMKFLREDLTNVLNFLSVRDRDILLQRFGLDDGHQRTLEEIGQRYGITRERVRQIEVKSLRKLRKYCKKMCLEDYIDQSPNNKLIFDNAYLFKNNRGISYVPEISEIIKRVIKLFPNESDKIVLYDKIYSCAKQNSYKESTVLNNCIIEKLKNI